MWLLLCCAAENWWTSAYPDQSAEAAAEAEAEEGGRGAPGIGPTLSGYPPVFGAPEMGAAAPAGESRFHHSMLQLRLVSCKDGFYAAAAAAAVMTHTHCQAVTGRERPATLCKLTKSFKQDGLLCHCCCCRSQASARQPTSSRHQPSGCQAAGHVCDKP